MSTPCNTYIDVSVGRGAGLFLEINGRTVDRSYGAMVMAEFAALREFPNVRVDVVLRTTSRPTPAAMARLIASELDRNEIWD